MIPLYFVTCFSSQRSSHKFPELRVQQSRATGSRELPNRLEMCWLGSGRTLDQWLASSMWHVVTIREQLAGSVRMWRCLADVAGRRQIGVADIRGERILWCKQM